MNDTGTSNTLQRNLREISEKQKLSPALVDHLERYFADIDADNLSVAVSRSASRSRRAQASAPRDSVGGTRGNHSLPILPPPSAKKPAFDSPSRGE